MCYIVPNFTLALCYHVENKILLIGRFSGKPINENLHQFEKYMHEF